jgi:hypothetical protein
MSKNKAKTNTRNSSQIFLDIDEDEAIMLMISMYLNKMSLPW